VSESWRDRAVTWPIGRLFLVLTVVTGVLGVLGFWWVDPGRAPTVPIIGGVLFAVFYSALMSLWVFLARHRERTAVGELSPAARVDLNRALRTGEAPREPALDQAALALIDRRRDRAERALRATPWLYGLVLVTVVINVVLEPSVFHFVFLALYLALVPAAVVSTRRQLARLNHADHAIRARATRSDA
jgi:hypothetical protein